MRFVSGPDFTACGRRTDWLARVSILRPGIRAQRAALSKPATNRVRARLRTLRKRTDLAGPGLDFETRDSRAARRPLHTSHEPRQGTTSQLAKKTDWLARVSILRPGIRAQRAALSKPATNRVRARLRTLRKKQTWLARVSILRPRIRAQRAALSKPATNRVRARLHSLRKKQTWLARVSILRPGIRAVRAALSKPATNRIRARLHSLRKKQTWLARVSILRPGIRAQRAALSKPATNRVRARLRTLRKKTDLAGPGLDSETRDSRAACRPLQTSHEPCQGTTLVVPQRPK
jgi:tetrahydromethanopterin S-methyltransferase subunit F